MTRLFEYLERQRNSHRPVLLSEVLGGEINPVLFEHRDKYGNLICRGIVHNTRTNVGRDWQSDVMGTLGTQPAASKYIGLTATNVSINGTETTLAGEITSGTLARAVYTAFNHTAGTASYNQTKTFTSDQTVTLQTAGEFIGTGAVTMPFIANISPVAGTVTGDTLTATWVKNI